MDQGSCCRRSIWRGSSGSTQRLDPESELLRMRSWRASERRRLRRSPRWRTWSPSRGSGTQQAHGSPWRPWPARMGKKPLVITFAVTEASGWIKGEAAEDLWRGREIACIASVNHASDTRARPARLWLFQLRRPFFSRGYFGAGCRRRAR